MAQALSSSTNFHERAIWPSTMIRKVRHFVRYGAASCSLTSGPPAFRVFQAEVWACPQEDALEALAESLGALRISRLVTENYRTIGEPDQGSKRAVELHRGAPRRPRL